MKNTRILLIIALAFTFCLSAGLAHSGTIAYTYDNAGRLTKAIYASDKGIAYTYDSAGNLLIREIQAEGAVTINAQPDELNTTAPWTLTGSNSYSTSGKGDFTINDLAPGDYTLTWGDLVGWTKPSPASSKQTLTVGGTITFTGTYTLIVGPKIQVTPSTLNFGYVPPGSYKDLTLTVKNIGTGTLSGTVSAAPPFSIVSGGTYNLASGASQKVIVRYTAPLQEGSQTGSVTFTGGGGTTIQVTGTNIKPRGLPWLQLLLGN